VTWPPHFKPTGIEKYDGKTDPREWLQVYELAIEAAGRDTRMMANYSPISLASATHIWLMGLPSRSIKSWSQLHRQFIGNFQATYERPENKWDLAQIVQKDGESVREYIQRFCSKCNTIPDIQDHSVLAVVKNIFNRQHSTILHENEEGRLSNLTKFHKFC
jgi:hypothetical protein